MKLSNNTALGIDISEGRINLALLRKNKASVQLLKAAGGPIPEGAVKDGNVQDPALLAKGIRELKRKSGIHIRLRQAAVSLVARPVLLQIVEKPKSASGGPAGIGQFVHNEVKHLVALSGKRIALDFCGIGSGGKLHSDRLLVVAVDNQNIAQLVKACHLVRVNVETIEPSLFAYARALYAKKMASNFDSNVLIAMVQSETLNLCVFRRQTIDFVRTRDIDDEKAQTGEICSRLGDEINAIIQFYDSVKDSDSSGRWEIIVLVDKVHLPDDAQERLRAKLIVSNLQVRRPSDACQDTTVVGNEAKVGTDASAVAIGLAMKLLVPNESNLRINLLPPEEADVKSFKRNVVITANILAAVMFGMVIAVAVLGLKVKSVNADIDHQKKECLLSDLTKLFKDEKVIDSHIKQFSDEPGRLDEILSTGSDVDWSALLDDIRKATPKSVCLNSLYSKGNSAIYLEGVGLSYEAIRWFVNTLGESEHIATASLIETEKDDEKSGLIRYTISCFRASGEVK